VWLAFCVGVVLGVFAQPLVDDELVELDLTTAHIVTDGREILVDALDDDLRNLTRKDLIQHVLRDRLRQCTILAALHVEAFDFRRGSEAIFDLDRGILFLLEQKQSLEDTVEVDFEKLITVIDGLLQLRRDFQSFRKLRDIGIDEDGIGVSVDDLRPDQQLASPSVKSSHIQLEAFCQLARVRQNLTTFERRQGCQWFGVEARVFKTKTAIH
jgi:hypothetical protein